MEGLYWVCQELVMLPEIVGIRVIGGLNQDSLPVAVFALTTELYGYPHNHLAPSPSSRCARQVVPLCCGFLLSRPLQYNRLSVTISPMHLTNTEWLCP